MSSDEGMMSSDELQMKVSQKRLQYDKSYLDQSALQLSPRLSDKCASVCAFATAASFCCIRKLAWRRKPSVSKRVQKHSVSIKLI
jgi:hypothetical protein